MPEAVERVKSVTVTVEYEPIGIPGGDAEDYPDQYIESRLESYIKAAEDVVGQVLEELDGTEYKLALTRLATILIGKVQGYYSSDWLKERLEARIPRLRRDNQ